MELEGGIDEPACHELVVCRVRFARLSFLL